MAMLKGKTPAIKAENIRSMKAKGKSEVEAIKAVETDSDEAEGKPGDARIEKLDDGQYLVHCDPTKGKSEPMMESGTKTACAAMADVMARLSDHFGEDA